MTIYETMDYMIPHYTKTDHEIYEFIKKFENLFINESINELVSNFPFSQAALTRFAKKLGFDGFSQFQYQLRIDQKIKEDSLIATPSLRSATYAKILEATEKNITNKEIEQLGNKILNADYLYTTGSNLSSLPAEYLKMGMRIFHLDNISFLSPDDFFIPAKNTKNNVILIYSAFSGRAYKEHLETLNNFKEQPYICLITMNPKHSLKKFANQVIILPETTMQDYGGKAITETLAFLMFNDMLFDYLKNI